MYRPRCQFFSTKQVDLPDFGRLRDSLQLGTPPTVGLVGDVKEELKEWGRSANTASLEAYGEHTADLVTSARVSYTGMWSALVP